MTQAAVAVAGAAHERFVLEYQVADGCLAARAAVVVSSARGSRRRCLPGHSGSGRGLRSFAGWWYFATTGAHVGFESWLERDHLMLMDFDPGVEAVSSQPFWLRWRDGDGRSRRHAPDFFARKADGTGMVVDVRPDDRVPARDAETFAVTAQACEAAGWEYRRAGDLDPVMVANVRWLSRYRHRRCLAPGIAGALLEAFAGGRGLFEGAELAGDRLRVLPVLFHLMWQRQLAADLTAPLGMSTVVHAGGAR